MSILATFVRHASATCTIVVVVVLAGCAHADLPVSPQRPGVAETQVGAAITCHAKIDARSVLCAIAPPTGSTASPSAPSSVSAVFISTYTFGGQGLYVRLASTNGSYADSDSVFSTDVTVQNLLAQSIGTTNGTTPFGMKVFFASGPTTTSGTGTVSVLNADGESWFTDADQSYFYYPDMLAPQAISAPRTWQFNVPPSVQEFDFTVFVNTALPHGHSVRRWTPELPESAVTGALYGIWGRSESDIFTVGQYGAILHRDSTGWTTQYADSNATFRGVAGVSYTPDVYVVGRAGAILKYDGTTWNSMTSDVTSDLYAVWVDPATLQAYAVGDSGTIVEYDGTSWTRMSSGVTATLLGITGTSMADIYAVGTEGTILHFDGVSWSMQSSPSTTTLDHVWEKDGSAAFASGPSGTVLHLNLFSSSDWRQETTNTVETLYGIWGTNGFDVFASGAGGSMLHFDGSTWQVEATGSFATLYALWGNSSVDVWAVGSNGTILRGAR